MARVLILLQALLLVLLRLARAPQQFGQGPKMLGLPPGLARPVLPRLEQIKMAQRLGPIRLERQWPAP